VIITKALNRTGNYSASEKFYYFMRKFSKIENYKEVFQRYNTNGLPSVTRKNQNDNEGLLLYGIYDTYLNNEKNETFLQNMWPLIEQTVKLIFSYSRMGLVKTKRSIHEHDGLERGYDIWVNCACWRGLRDSSEVARILGQRKKSIKWRKKADKLERNIRKKLFNKKLGIYLKNKRHPLAPDISMISPFYFEMEDSKKILKNTMDYLYKHIWNREIGGFRRFRKFEICRDWHWYTGGSGSWCSFTCIAAKYYRKLGDKKKYNECLRWIKAITKASNGLIPEHIATKAEYDDWKAHEIEFNSRIINEMKKAEKSIKKLKDKNVVYWANPLGWSHAEYILLFKE